MVAGLSSSAECRRRNEENGERGRVAAPLSWIWPSREEYPFDACQGTRLDPDEITALQEGIRLNLGARFQHLPYGLNFEFSDVGNLITSSHHGVNARSVQYFKLPVEPASHEQVRRKKG